MHIDHIYPWSMGGSNDPLNLVALCDRCNLGKGARVWVPPKMLATPRDDKGFAVWKRFGSWNIEVSDADIIAHWDRPPRDYVWFEIRRCWEGTGPRSSWDCWVEHFGRKAVHQGCDDDCWVVTADDMLGPDPLIEFELMTVADFLRKPRDRFWPGTITPKDEDRKHKMFGLVDAIDFLRSISRKPVT